MGVDFLVGHSPGGPLPHTGCFGEPWPDRALRHAISSHADGPFCCLGYGPNFGFSFGTGVAPIWAHILHSLWHVTSCKMALEARIGFTWASPVAPLHQATPPTLFSPAETSDHGGCSILSIFHCLTVVMASWSCHSLSCFGVQCPNQLNSLLELVQTAPAIVWSFSNSGMTSFWLRTGKVTKVKSS